jgi:hypothetical protein
LPKEESFPYISPEIRLDDALIKGNLIANKECGRRLPGRGLTPAKQSYEVATSLLKPILFQVIFDSS